jgi:membrane associated rhomboid family serine protease
MATRRIPVITLGLLLAIVVLHWLAPDKTLLFFSAADITRGETWRILSGHFMHADLEHLLWNGVGLAVLGTLIELRSRIMLWAALGAGIVSVREWRVSRSWLVIAIALGSVLKAVIEAATATSIVTNISWPPYAWSHVAGLFGGAMTAISLHWSKQTPGISLQGL